MNELVLHGLDARTDWDAYHSAAKMDDPRYHNRPNCEEGAAIAEADIREGTDHRPLCDACRSAEKPAH
jgi:hypothetical protein